MAGNSNFYAEKNIDLGKVHRDATSKSSMQRRNLTHLRRQKKQKNKKTRHNFFVYVLSRVTIYILYNYMYIII